MTLDEGYDIIGDVHGYAGKLETLLDLMGYTAVGGVREHPNRQAVFVGDLIDRGPCQVETVRLVKTMVDAGTAQIVLANHEFNAVAWHTPDPDDPSQWLRPHTEKNRRQHHAFLGQVGEGSPGHRDLVEWFMTLPLWLDLGDLRVVHACWDPLAIRDLEGAVGEDNSLTPELVIEASRRNTTAHRAIEHLLKGPEISIVDPFFDKDGHERDQARFRWWSPTAGESLRQAALIPPGAAGRGGAPYPTLPDTPLGSAPPVAPYRDQIPAFYGHYWETGTPSVSSEYTACVDYSAGNGGPLVAYRWQGERTLTDAHFVTT